MSRRDKLLANWKNQPQPSATVDTVEAVLRSYFGAAFSIAEGGSHQLRVSHPALFQHPHFVGGTLSIPVKGGQSVKPFYLKRIVEAVEITQAAERPSQDQPIQDHPTQETEQAHDTTPDTVEAGD